MKNKKNKKNTGDIKVQSSINKKTQLIKVILDDVYQILTLFKPLMSRMIAMDEAREFRENGTFNKAAELFGNIALNSKELETQAAQDFLNLTN